MQADVSALVIVRVPVRVMPLSSTAALLLESGAVAFADDIYGRAAERGERHGPSGGCRGLSLHVQRSGSHPFRVLAQPVVRLRRAVA